MVNSIKKTRTWLLFLTLLSILSLTSCRAWINDDYEAESNTEIKVYTINPTTILDSINRGDTNVFTLQEGTPEADGSSPSETVAWSQADFFLIARALHEQFWKEPLNEQNLYNMSFTMDCTGVDQGTFSEAEFLSFKVIKNGAEETRIQYRIQIIPSESLIYTSKAEYRPNIRTKDPFNLTQYRISAEEALQTAEINGGSEKRLEFKNDCRISALAPGPDSKGWRVLYQNNRNQWWTLFFEIAIDPQNGFFKVLSSK